MEADDLLFPPAVMATPEDSFMPTGRVKTFDETRNFGFVVSDDTGRDIYVHRDDVAGGGLRSGDVVEFELEDGDRGRKAVDVNVVREAPPENLIGRVMAPPPSWEELEERERQARQQRRRRR